MLFRSVLLIYFGVVAIIDLEHRLILHPVSLVGVGLGTVFGFWRHGLQATLFGGAVGFGSMLLLYGLGKLFAQGLSRLRKQAIEEEALGFGDVTLSGIVGLLLGWPGILVGLVLAILIGGVVSLLYLLAMLITRRYRPFTAIPYGPFLIVAALILLF
jgi:leader peptidase (prepilin peptidase)/N-methyltransferase